MTGPSPLVESTNIASSYDSCSYHVRKFCSTTDTQSLERICRNVHGGTDYLPRVAHQLEKDPKSTLLVLVLNVAGVDDCVIEQDVVAVGNIREFKAGMSWLEAIRTCESRRGKGLATALVSELLSRAKENGRETFSCTVGNNHAMQKVFDRVGMQRVSQIHQFSFETLKKLPGWGAAADDKEQPQPLIQALRLEHLIDSDVQNQANVEPKTIETKEELDSVLNRTKAQKGGIGHVVGFYELVSDDAVLTALSNKQVWTLNVNSNGDGREMDACSDFALVTLYRDERISSLKSPWVLSVSASSVKAFEMALVFGCREGVASIQRLGEAHVGFAVSFDLWGVDLDLQSTPLIDALPICKDAWLLFSTCKQADV
eukprot:TRINITY_DN11823_c0_g1_i1.p1 TRINITY_DN11823_c0_g1~~TRINITY_DN11823_c0_g1_i1.p1  ORF type:complete len:371 (-),score=37.81 TRINITY_DN11823_c0_g1_i1:255-1367(-)